MNKRWPGSQVQETLPFATRCQQCWGLGRNYVEGSPPPGGLHCRVVLCTNCVGTGLCPIPWTELFIAGRNLPPKEGR